MTDKKMVTIDKVPFAPVAWGRSKILVGPTATGSGLALAEHIRVGVTEYDPDTPHEPHSHPGQEEVIWVLKGRGLHRDPWRAPGAVPRRPRLHPLGPRAQDRRPRRPHDRHHHEKPGRRRHRQSVLADGVDL